MTPEIEKVLIANRGEIACRIIQTVRAMGLQTVAVYSDADEHARHVAMADEAVRIGAAPVGESYLRADLILKAAKDTNTDAIHPGYGFLSENAEFAAECENAGIIFIGPTANNIRKMGLKDEAKKLMIDAGVPVVPGYLGENQDPDHLLTEAEKIGFPVLIKAVAGGGGKGMRRVDTSTEFPAALRGAKREAAGAFGNDQVLIEKFIEKPRHIEVQVFADTHGNAVHLFERDCSLQRRHQKVVEEAPAPHMTDFLRGQMGSAAVAAARAIDYRGAGTIEFIVDVANGLDGAPFYFMEMNTRLQVEHPVTEMITGEDLVEWQIRVASGEELPFDQGDLEIDGHAIEVRLYAEDPARDFLPATGRLTRFRPPLDEDFTRVETGVREGDVVSVHYDPMIAKIICWGEDRATALRHLSRALDQTEIAGLSTNLDFLRHTINHPAFAVGDVDTGFIPRHIKDLVPAPQPASDSILCLSVLGIIAAREKRAQETARASHDPWSPWAAPTNWRANLERSDTQRFIDATDEERTVTSARKDQGFILTIDGVAHHAHFHDHSEDSDLCVVIDGKRLNSAVQVTNDAVTVISGGRTHHLKRLSSRVDLEDDADGPGAIIAPMPGKILDVLVADGDEVEKDQPLLILEAMKMEHTLTAPRAGTVTGLTAKDGMQVNDGTVLAQIAD